MRNVADLSLQELRQLVKDVQSLMYYDPETGKWTRNKKQADWTAVQALNKLLASYDLEPPYEKEYCVAVPASLAVRVIATSKQEALAKAAIVSEVYEEGVTLAAPPSAALVRVYSQTDKKSEYSIEDVRNPEDLLVTTSLAEDEDDEDEDEDEDEDDEDDDYESDDYTSDDGWGDDEDEDTEDIP